MTVATVLSTPQLLSAGCAKPPQGLLCRCWRRSWQGRSSVTGGAAATGPGPAALSVSQPALGRAGCTAEVGRRGWHQAFRLPGPGQHAHTRCVDMGRLYAAAPVLPHFGTLWAVVGLAYGPTDL